MNDLPLETPAPRSPIRLVAIWVASLLAIAVVAAFAVAAFHQEVEQRRLAGEEIQFQKSELRAKTYLEAARANKHLLEARMLVERPQRIARIASQTGFPPDFVDEYFGWFTGLDDPVLFGSGDRELEVLNIPPAFWACRNTLETRYKELNPQKEKPYSPFDAGKVSKRFAQMTTDSAVGAAMRTNSTRNRDRPDLNPTPRETKYDVSSEPTKYDDVAAYIVLKRDVPFAWLIEREHVGSGDGNLGMAASRAISFLSDAVDRRIAFMIHGLEPPRNAGGLPPKP